MTRKQDPLTIEYLLLGIIRKTPIHTYDLNKMLLRDADLSQIWRFNQSQLYAVLDKIERNKLIESKIAPGASFPFRKVYSITELGDREFNSWLVMPVGHVNLLRSDFMAKLYFLQSGPREVMLSVLDAQAATAKRWIAHISQDISALSETDNYQRMLYNYRLSMARVALEWLEECKGENGAGNLSNNL